MRRKDREMGREFGLRLIDKSEYGTISMVDENNMPYGLPLSIIRDDEVLYFHSAKDGKKVNILDKNPFVSISFVGNIKIPENYSEKELEEIAKDDSKAILLISSVFTTEFQSTIVRGKVESVKDEEEKIKAMRILCEKYTPDKMKYFDLAIKAGLDKTKLYKLQIEEISSKRKKYDKYGKEMKWKRMECILCKANVELFERWRAKDYYKCEECDAIFLDPKDYIDFKAEKERYEKHNNDVYDKNYQRFVLPLVDAVLEDYKKEDKGLDFGAGTGPVISKLLKDRSYDIKIYDPFFANYPEKLEEKYDYIVSCEVIEHFHEPLKEFRLLKSILKSGGRLYIKTEIYNKDIDFKSWTYKNDSTHVIFYQEKTLEWIKKEVGFSSLKIEKDFITYK